MEDNLNEVEKIENEIELSGCEREKLKEFLKKNLEIMLSKESNDNVSGDWGKILSYKELEIIYENSFTNKNKDKKYPKRLAFKSNIFNDDSKKEDSSNYDDDDEFSRCSLYFELNNYKKELEKSVYPMFCLYNDVNNLDKKYILLIFGYWFERKKFSSIDWDKRINEIIFYSIEDYFSNNKIEVEEKYNKDKPTYYQFIPYKAYTIENNLEEQIDKITSDLENILNYYISYIDIYKKYKEKINNDEEIERKDLKEILEYYIEYKSNLSEEKEECEKEIKEYDKKFFEFLKTIQKFDIDFSFPLNTILYGTPEIEKNYAIYSVGIIERNKIISKEDSKENFDLNEYKKITNFNNYKTILERFKGYMGNGQIEFIPSDKPYTNDDFKETCEKARKDEYNNNYVLIIENIDKRDKMEIFGEDYSELENRLSSKENSKIPKNLYILGTINTFSNFKAFLNVDFFNSFNFIKMYSEDEIKENIGEIDEEIEDLLGIEKNNIEFPLNTILYGPPGTGKTYNSIFYSVGIANKNQSVIDKIKNSGNISEKENENISDEEKEEAFKLFKELKENEKEENRQIEFVTFHQSYSYEDFVEGIRPTLAEENETEIVTNEDKKDLKYTLHSGIFKNICERAKNNPTVNYVLIIDEINRGNISKIFGELITLIEPSKRLGGEEELKIRLPYSGEEFGVPKNLYILGTMNTADRSIALLDIALRRRFDFIEMSPKYFLLKNIEEEKIDLRELLEAINTRIEFLLDKDHLIGHSYFLNIKTFDKLKEVFKNSIVPLLQEYFYDDFEKIKFILNIKDDNDEAIIIKEEFSFSESDYKNFSKALKNKLENKSIYKINENIYKKDDNKRDTDKKVGFYKYENYINIYKG